MYSGGLVEAHFLARAFRNGDLRFAMWNSGIIQGLMWRTYNESGTLAYSFVDIRRLRCNPYYIASRHRRPAVPDRRVNRLLQTSG